MQTALFLTSYCLFIFSALSLNFQRTENKKAAHCGKKNSALEF